MLTLGTAGHIDHGKSSLVKALTSIDPDRLPEEKARGMTIDLGFAWLQLPSGEIAGLVDVPGHKQFINHVIPGLFAIDAVLLVVAADDGWMPQTEEHLRILDLLGIRHGIAVLNKIDLVNDPEWLELVEKDITQHLAGTSLAGIPVMRVSTRTGQGMAELRNAVAAMASSITPRRDIGKPRLAVDRVFNIKGSGVVVTGTLSQGTFNNNDAICILPARLGGHIRAIESYKQVQAKAQPGSRVALNLGGIKREDIKRGDIIVPAASNAALSRMINTEIRLLPALNTTLKNMDEVLVYMETRELLARVILPGMKAVKPGDTAPAQLRFTQDVASFIGERFIIRQQSPALTIGGGTVLDPEAARFKSSEIAALREYLSKRRSLNLEDIIFSDIDRRGHVAEAGLLDASLFSRREIESKVKELVRAQKLVQAAGYLLAPDIWNRWTQRLLEWLQQEHESDKSKKGASQIAAQTALGIPRSLFDALVAQAASTGVLVRESDTLYLPRHKPSLSRQQESIMAAILQLCARDSTAPPSIKDIEAQIADGAGVVRYMLQQGLLVELPDGILMEAGKFTSIKDDIIGMLKEKGEISIQDINARFGFSRKYSIPLLTCLDRLGITRRQGDIRVAGKKLA